MTPAASAILVIGYGNTLRGDDGVGPVVAEAIGALDLPGVTCRAVSQLTPEQAAWLAPARVAVFVDARVGPATPAVAVERIQPANGTGLPTHAGDARSLLSLTEVLYGNAPLAWLVTVAGVDFGLRETLSAEGQRHAREAQKRIEWLLQSLTRGEPCMSSA